MMFTLTSYAVPAIVALLAKGGMFFYAGYSKIHNLRTRLYLLFLFSLSIQNLAEITAFVNRADGLLEPWAGKLYFGATIPAFAFLLHLALAMAANGRTLRGDASPGILALIYVPVVVLEILLWGSSLLVVGFQPMAYTYTKIPGPLYFLFELQTVGCLAITTAVLVYGMRNQAVALRRLQSKFLLIGLLPVVAVVVMVIVLQRFGFRGFNSTATFPIAMTFFLAVTAYAIHQHRLFDIDFFIPWSKVRKRKTAFYARIQATIAEIVDLRSVQEVLDLIASTLRCQVALIGGIRPMVALVQGQKIVASHRLTDFPREALLQVGHIVVTNEVADSRPELYALLKEHRVGAIVPFASHGSTAGNWMLLGEHFSDNVYTPLDFKVVESLFARIADLFVDGLLLVRSQLAEAKEELEKYRDRLALAWHQSGELEAERRKLQEEAARLREENSGLRRERFQVIAGGVADGLPPDVAAGKVTLHAYLDQCEAQMLCAALKLAKGNKNEAARLLGFKDHRGLRYLLERHNIDPKESA